MFRRRIETALRSKSKSPFVDGIKNIRVVRETKLKFDDEIKNGMIEYSIFHFIVKFSLRYILRL